MTDFWDFDEDELAWNSDRTLAAGAWVERRRASAGEYERWYEYAVWEAATGREIHRGHQYYSTGMWGRSGADLERINIEGNELVIHTSEGVKRERIEKPAGGAPAPKPADQATLLSFWGNRLGPDYAAALASSPDLRGVTELDLRGNLIGVKGAHALADSRTLRSLESLQLYSVDVPSEGLEPLRKRFGDALEVSDGKPLVAEGDRPFWTPKEFEIASKELTTALLPEKCEVATQCNSSRAGLDGPPSLAVFLQGAKLIPRDPETSFLIEPALAKQGGSATVEGLYLRCGRSLVDRARGIFQRFQEALLKARG